MENFFCWSDGDETFLFRQEVWDKEAALQKNHKSLKANLIKHVTFKPENGKDI